METTVKKKKVEVYSCVYEKMGIHSDIGIEVNPSYEGSIALKVSVMGDHVQGDHTFSCADVSFLKGLHFDYMMSKLVGEPAEVDNDAWKNKIKGVILDNRRNNALNKGLARKAYSEVEYSFSDKLPSDVIIDRIYQSDKIDFHQVFCELEDIFPSYVYPDSFKIWWDFIWKPFVETYCKRESTYLELCIEEEEAQKVHEETDEYKIYDICRRKKWNKKDSLSMLEDILVVPRLREEKYSFDLSDTKSVHDNLINVSENGVTEGKNLEAHPLKKEILEFADRLFVDSFGGEGDE